MEHALTPLPQTIWEGSVGVAFHVRRDGRTGDHYLTFEPVRRAKNDANGVWSYPHDFSQRNAQALGVVIAKALRLIAETDAKRWVASRGQPDAAVDDPQPVTPFAWELTSSRPWADCPSWHVRSSSFGTAWDDDCRWTS